MVCAVSVLCCLPQTARKKQQCSFSGVCPLLNLQNENDQRYGRKKTRHARFQVLKKNGSNERFFRVAKNGRKASFTFAERGPVFRSHVAGAWVLDKVLSKNDCTCTWREPCIVMGLHFYVLEENSIYSSRITCRRSCCSTFAVLGQVTGLRSICRASLSIQIVYRTQKRTACVQKS